MTRAVRFVAAWSVQMVFATGAGGQSVGRLHVRPEPSETVVAVALRLDVGRRDEATGEVGVAELAARAVVEGATPELVALGGRTTISCGRNATTMTLVAPVSTWEAATTRLLDAVFEPAIDSAALATARAALVRSTRLDNGNPTWQVRVVTRQALFGVTHPWARPECGLPESMELVAADTVRARARAWFRPDRAWLAVHGPVDADAVRTLLAGRLGGAPAAEGAPLATMAMARAAERNTITAWVGLAFPFTGTGDAEALGLLGLHLRDVVGPAPDRPGVLGVATEVERFPGGGALYVYFLTAPDRALAVARQVREAVAAAAAGGVPVTLFEALLRRYRGERLRELAAPESRARRSVALIAGQRPPSDVAANIDRMDRARLRNAAAFLGPPAMGAVGPEQLVEAITP